MASLAPLATVRADTTVDRSEVLVIGKVSDNPRKHYHRLKPIVDYAAERLADVGIRRGRVLMARDNAQMIEYLKEGRVDWVTETLFSAVRFVDEAGARIVLLKHKKGAKEYETVFIARRDSGIQALADLAGKVLAVEDPGSTSAYFLPRYLLLRVGLTPRRVNPGTASPAAGEVGLAFARGEINIAMWVHEGLADAGAYSDMDWDTPDHTPPSLRENLRIFHRSAPLARAVELFRPGLEPAVRERLMSTLLRAHEDPDGRRALYAYQRTSQFERPDAGLQRNIADVRAMLQVLEGAD
ncbi:phosphate/phosphite/phosphonate ABC transporter substrate-binding protein [Ectothiorhodospiraceae bacterium WFHF3C12]|nr:phosphate/phosphite/phosphonate ABC transporter substrate-binding protein [Ectothiorhodospiraceae bacterium WFHF3C12]